MTEVAFPLEVVAHETKFLVTAEVELLVEARDMNEACQDAMTTLDQEATIVSGVIVEVRRTEEGEY